MSTSSKKLEASNVLVPLNPSELSSGDISVIGAPLVIKPEHRRSTALGPSAIRRAIEEVFALISNSSDKSIENLDAGKKRSINSEFCMYDLGDLASNSEKGTILPLFSFLGEKNVVPVILGGEREIGSWCCEAMSEIEPDCAIVNLTPSITNSDYLSNTATCFIGLNGLIPAKYWKQSEDNSHILLSADAIHENGTQYAIDILAEFLKEQKRVFWHIDVSAVDTGHASGTSDINIGGLSPEQILEILDQVSPNSRIAGCALTNVAPEFDKRGLSEYFAAEALIRVIAPALWD